MAIADQKTAARRPGFTFDALLEQDHSRWPVFLRLIKECMAPHWTIVAIAIAAMLVAAATAGVVPFVLQKVGDDVFVAKNEALVFALPAFLVIAVLVRAVADWVATVAEASLGSRSWRTSAIGCSTPSPPPILPGSRRNHSGRFVSTFINDAAIIDRAATRVMVGLFRNGMSAVFLLVAMFYMDWRLSFFVLVGAPIAVINLGRQRTRIRRASGRGMQGIERAEQHADADAAEHACGEGLRPGGERGAALPADRPQPPKIPDEGDAQRAPRSGRCGRSCRASASRRRSSTAAGRGSMAMSRSAQFMGFMTAALLAFQPLKALASIHATLGEGLLAAERVFAVIDYSSHVNEKRGCQAAARDGWRDQFPRRGFRL